MMSKSEHYTQDLIRLELSKHGLVFRTNAGSAWGGKYTNIPNLGNVVINPRKIELLPKGFSDLLFVGTDGRVAFIECKDDKGTLRPEQEKFIKLMQSYGHRAGVARNVREALLIIGVEDKNEMDEN
jgi:hypothetical protein